MKHWMRIVLVVFMLLGATLSFGYWSLDRFDDALGSMVASPAAIILPVYLRPNASGSSALASSASSTLASEQNDLDSKFELTFSPKKSEVYVGCTYEISWLASTTIKSMETAFVNASTSEQISSEVSGLAKENNIGTTSQSLKWKVGVVLPGEYLISISNVNGVATDAMGQKFTVNQIPKGSDEKKRKSLCEGTGGGLI